MAKQNYSNATKELPVAITTLAYTLLEKEVARRKQAGLTASRKGVATEAIFAHCGVPEQKAGAHSPQEEAKND